MPRAITTICAFAALILSFVSSLAQEAKPAEEQRTPWFDHWRYSVFSFGVIATDDHTKRNFFGLSVLDSSSPPMNIRVTSSPQSTYSMIRQRTGTQKNCGCGLRGKNVNPYTITSEQPSLFFHHLDNNYGSGVMMAQI